MKKKVLLALRVLLITSVICTLLFTFYQSSLPSEKSEEVSDGVSEKLEPIIPSDTPTGEFVHTNIRKIAHFVEFSVLGLEVSLYVVFFTAIGSKKLKDKLPFIGASYPFSITVALIDETIQVFTARGPAITDVWLDVLGFVFSATLVYLVFLAVNLIMRRKADRTGQRAQNGE